MRSKAWIAGLAIVAGLVFSSTAGTDTAKAHGNGTCRYFFDTGSTYWPPSQKITKDQAGLFAYRAMQICYYVTVESSPPVRAVFWDWINNSAATVIVWNAAGRVHGCTVDRDQTYANGRWFSGFNVACTNN